MKQTYKDINFGPDKLQLIDTINDVITDYVKQGYRLTVRQLYYQLVARDIVPNTVQSYKRIVSVVSDARYAGLTDWDAIEDRTREFVQRGRWGSAHDILDSCAKSFHMDMWATQPCRVFVIVEKEALAGVIEHACRPWDVPMLAARGYASGSVLREFAVNDIIPALNEDKEVLVLHLGDQ